MPVTSSSPPCGFCMEVRNGMSEWTNKFYEWLKRPYSEEMSAWRWFLFAGLLIVIAWMWSTILRKIAD